MATKTVTLKDTNGDTLYPVTDSNVVNINQQKTLAQALDGVVYAEDPTQSATPTAWVTNNDLDYGTLVKTGIWTNTTTLPSTASSANTTIDVSSLGFSSADDYIVVATNMGGANNDPFLVITIPSADKTATSFTLTIWNAHWASGSISSGTKIQWAVFRLN